jgi:hypothetical protein
MEIDYKSKYLKYKSKYLELKQQIGGGKCKSSMYKNGKEVIKPDGTTQMCDCPAFYPTPPSEKCGKCGHNVTLH